VALSGGEVIGHLQLVDTGRPGTVELKNMAVRETHQGRGVGRRLLQAAMDLAGGSRAPPRRVLPGHLRSPRRTETRDWIGDKGYVGRGMITPIKKTNLENLSPS
jgi:GNAT superfamily N-acetyltransferase